MSENPDDELAADGEVAARLVSDRPSPASHFRANLGRQLSDQNPGWGPRPQYLWPMSLALIAAGIILLLIGVLVCV